MKNRSRFCKCIRVGLAVTLFVGSELFGFTTRADDSKHAAHGTQATQGTEGTEGTQAKKLTGAELYAINCNRCHAERYPTEFSSAQWQTLLTHMRVRANLPAKQAREILKYLQEESGN